MRERIPEVVQPIAQPPEITKVTLEEKTIEVASELEPKVELLGGLPELVAFKDLGWDGQPHRQTRASFSTS